MYTVQYTLRHFADKKKDHPHVQAYRDGLPTDHTIEDKILLYATYIRELGDIVPGKFDGSIIIDNGSKRTLRVICGCDGKMNEKDRQVGAAIVQKEFEL